MIRSCAHLFVFLILIICYGTTTVSGSSKQRPTKVPSSSSRKLNNADDGSKKDEGGVDKDDKTSNNSSDKGRRWTFFQRNDDKNESNEEGVEADEDSKGEEDDESKKGFQFFRRNKKDEKKDQSKESNSEEKESKSDSATKSKNDDDDTSKENEKKDNNKKRKKKKKEEKTAADDVEKNEDSENVEEEKSSKNNDAVNATISDDEKMNSNTTTSTTEQDEENYNNSTSEKNSDNNQTLTLRDLILMQSPMRSSPPSSPFNSPSYFNQRFPQQQHPHRNINPDSNNNQLAGMTIVFAPIIASLIKFGVIFFILHKSTDTAMLHPTQHFVWERLNDRYIHDVTALKTVIDLPPHGVSSHRWRQQKAKKRGKKRKIVQLDLNKAFTRTVVVIDGNNISQQHLANTINFLIGQHRNHAFGTEKGTSQPLPLEILFKIDSPGGPVGTFGLAASQVSRLRSIDGITTTVCVDQCAASGGYMIASQANKLIAAPFATVGSIGVIMEGLNFHDILRQYGIRPFTLKAGENKNPITQYGQINKDAMDSVNEDLDRIHAAFKAVVIKGRPQLLQLEQKDNNSNKKIKTNKNTMDGSVYLGEEAKELRLVDEVMTSEEYIMDRICAGDRVLQLHKSNGIRKNIFGNALGWMPHFVKQQMKTISMKFTQAIPLLSTHNNYLNSVLSDNKQIVKIGSVVGLVQYLSSKYTMTGRI